MARVVIEHFYKNYKGPGREDIVAVSDANLVVEDGEFLVLVGPSGCGKSTVLRTIAGLEEITQGAISIDGQIVNDLPPQARDVAMVFQNYALYPHMTVFENMAFGLKLRKLPKLEIQQRVQEAAAILGLAPLLDRLPKALSGGQRQRVAVCRAIVRKPKVFLFDEPLSNLDAQMRVQMRTEISRLHARLGATMIYVTHDQAEAMTMGDRIAVMKDGIIQQVAEPLRLYQQPANLFVAGFIGSPPMNFFKGVLLQKGDMLYFAEQNGRNISAAQTILRVDAPQNSRLAGYVGNPVVLGVRPENIANSLDESQRENGVAATVELVEPMGAETWLHLSTGAHRFIARVPAANKSAVNDQVSLTFDMAKAHFFDPVSELAVA